MSHSSRDWLKAVALLNMTSPGRRSSGWLKAVALLNMIDMSVTRETFQRLVEAAGAGEQGIHVRHLTDVPSLERLVEGMGLGKHGPACSSPRRRPIPREALARENAGDLARVPSLERALAKWNICCMVVTLLTSQRERSWLKACAPKNMHCIVVAVEGRLREVLDEPPRFRRIGPRPRPHTGRRRRRGSARGSAQGVWVHG